MVGVGHEVLVIRSVKLDAPINLTVEAGLEVAPKADLEVDPKVRLDNLGIDQEVILDQEVYQENDVGEQNLERGPGVEHVQGVIRIRKMNTMDRKKAVKRTLGNTVEVQRVTKKRLVPPTKSMIVNAITDMT